MKLPVSNVNVPTWRDITAKSHVPSEFEPLLTIARNMWWAWNYEARELFNDLDPELWKEVSHNPVLLLERISYDKLSIWTLSRMQHVRLLHTSVWSMD